MQNIHPILFYFIRAHGTNCALHSTILFCTDADRVQCDKIAQMLEEEGHQQKKHLCQDLVKFREREQQPSMRREWDIHDPEAVLKGQPARVSDDDPRCGPSSMQCFSGEDLNAATRQKLQKKQNKHALEEQRNEQKKELADQKYAGMFGLGNEKQSCSWDELYLHRKSTKEMLLCSCYYEK